MIASLRTSESGCRSGDSPRWPLRAGDAEIDQAPAQMGAIHPFATARVVRVGHQQRQAEIAQQPLGRAFPVALVVAHLDQLAGEGHVVLAQVERRAQRGADRHLLARRCCCGGLQAVDLGGQLVVLLPALARRPRRAR